MLALEGQLGSVAAGVMTPEIGFILSETEASFLITENQQVTRLLCWERTLHLVAFLHPLCLVHHAR